MAASNVTEMSTSSSGNSVLSAEDGFILGIQMLREMREAQFTYINVGGEEPVYHEPFSIEHEVRAPGVRQRNIVSEYLEKVRVHGGGEVERGFTAFLTEYLSSCFGGVPDLEPYEDIVETETI